ncbi:hypothetical protein F5Y05DRAFT_187687 [Hypoxylon sp. FL0543]|nr:hypothetical protein F5Y05DRAFT_187687 [Hypoxylon sp. FL0543]
MTDYATPAAISGLTATAALMLYPVSYRPPDRLYRANKSDENSPFQHRLRPPFANTRSRHSYAHYGEQLYDPAGLHEHYEHHSECPGAQCHYQAFLVDSIQRYNESRRDLRQTYVWNLRQLARAHQAQPRKPAADKDAEADRLYAYYVSRARDVFEAHRRDHRRLFGQDYLRWAPPEREDALQLQLRSCCASGRTSRRGSGSGASGDGRGMIPGVTNTTTTTTNANADTTTATPATEERRESGSDCERGDPRVDTDTSQAATKEKAAN